MIIIFSYKLIAFIIGVFIASQTSYYILLVAILGGIILILYAFGPLPISYTPIGEIVSGVTMGIGITTVIYIQSDKLFFSFLCYDKSIHTKDRSMGLIGQVGLKYHLAVIIGLLIAIIL